MTPQSKVGIQTQEPLQSDQVVARHKQLSGDEPVILPLIKETSNPPQKVHPRIEEVIKTDKLRKKNLQSGII